MNSLRSTIEFIVYEGALLAVLFFVVAFAVAVLQQVFGKKLNDALGKTSLESGAVLAATAGAVTPFCSCSTVPVLSGMLRARVRFGVCFTFLISSPVINEGVLLVLLKEKSVAIAAVFLLVAAALSIGFGILVDRLGMGRYVRPAASGLDIAGAIRVGGDESVVRVPWSVRLRFAAFAAWSELRSAGPYLAIGVVFGSLIYGYVPQNLIEQLQQQLPGTLLIVAMALAGVPFYVNSTMVIPIAVALLAKGVDIGPVTAFLVSAAGTSIPEMILLAKLFRAPLILSHMLVIVVSATLIGVTLQWATQFF
ncbi:MAG: hypothetical protein HEQ39_17150 [Rhizobacter sp.]